jgi:hypothetical protein
MVEGVRAMPEFESVSKFFQAAKFSKLEIYDLGEPFIWENGS